MSLLAAIPGRVRFVLLCVLTFTLGVATLAFGAGVRPAHAAVSPIIDRGAQGMTADGLSTVQIDGIVWTQVVVGDTVYAGGNFTTARPAGAAPGESTVPRWNLLAFDITTGELKTGFAPKVEGGAVRALAVSPDKKTLYVGGAFSSVDGAKRSRFAAITLADGTLQSMAPAFSNEVTTILAASGNIFVGGYFTKVGTATRQRLAALTTTGQLRPWAPAADGTVRAMTRTPDGRSLVVGGSFYKIGRVAACGMTRLSMTTGAVQSWSINTLVKNCGPSTAILSLTADATKVYGSGFSSGGGNYEGVFAASGTGRVEWLQDCRGDTYSVAVANGRVYSVGHAHNCGNIGGFPEGTSRTYYPALAATTDARGTVGYSPGGYRTFAGKPAPSLVNWFPALTPGKASGQEQAAWSVVASGPYIVLGGEFTQVNGVPQQGLVRMISSDYAPRKQGPINAYTALKPTLVVNADRSVTVSWKSAWDRDDQELTYEVIRDGQVIDSRTQTSHRWVSTPMQFLDTGAVPGKENIWRIRTIDPDGNAVMSVTASAMVPGPSSEVPAAN